MSEVFSQVITDAAIQFPQDCYFCGRRIESAEGATYLPVSLKTNVKDKNGDKKIKNKIMLRVLHHECSSKIVVEQTKRHDEELEFRDKTFVLFCKLIGINLEDENGQRIKSKDRKQKIPKYLVTRIDGLRQGRTFSRDQNVHTLDKGFSFKTIYTALVIIAPLVETAIRGKVFANDRHKINYIMSILDDRIPSVVAMQIRKETADKKLDKWVSNLFNGEVDESYEIVVDESLKQRNIDEDLNSYLDSMFDSEDPYEDLFS